MADGQMLDKTETETATLKPFRPRGVEPRLLLVDDLIALTRAGRFGEMDKSRVELVDGRLYLSPAEGMNHLDGSGRVGEILLKWMIRTGLDKDYRLIPNYSYRISDIRLLQADWAVVRRGLLEYEDWPKPDDIPLVVEIANTSLRYDEGDKKSLYAEAGQVEYWVLRVESNDLRVCRSPQNGVFSEETILNASHAVTPLLGGDDAGIDLSDLLKPN